jgi:ribosomal protein S27AE
MSHKESLNCPTCGAVMNHHATKVNYGTEAAADDEVFGGVLEEVHTCPHCGHIELRQASN